MNSETAPTGREAKESDEAQRPKIGVYVCRCGGNISDVVDVERVAQAAEKLDNVEVARVEMFMCSDPGQAAIEEDIRQRGLNRVVVASCSPFLHEKTFRGAVQRAGLNPYLYEHANIREQDSWVHKSDPEGATRKAIALVAAAVGKARALDPLTTLRIDAARKVVVIGGGVAGLRSALDLADADIPVVLLERSPFLGGRMAQLDKVFPTNEDARELLHLLIDKAAAHPLIDIRTNAEVQTVNGYIGQFDLTVRQRPRGVTEELTQPDKALAACPEETENEYDYGLTRRKALYKPYEGCFPNRLAIDWDTCTRCGQCRDAVGGKGIDLETQPETFELRVGALVVATGFDHYEPRPGEFGYGEYPEVTTLPRLIRYLHTQDQNSSFQWHGRPVRSVGFLHCVGSRQLEGVHEPDAAGNLNQHCSRVCCTATLQLINEIKDKFPQVDVYDFYQDIRTYGHGHEDYYEQASKKGTVFLRYLGEAPPQVERNDGEDEPPVLVRLVDTLTFGEEVEVPLDLLVLSVGVVPRDQSHLIEMLNLPVGADRFLLEVHPKLRPVETAVNGVMLAGSAQGPMDITEASAAASAAASKAAAIVAGKQVELEPFVAEVDLTRCEGAGLCVKECEYEGAIALVEMEVDGQIVKRAAVNPALCSGCGACVAVCPHQALDIRGYTLQQVEAMVDGIVAATAAGETAGDDGVTSG